MVLILSLFLSSGFVFGGGKWIKKNAWLCYCICALLSAGTVVAVWSGIYTEWSEGIWAYPVGVFTQGGLAGSLFLHVMYAGAVRNGSVYMKKVMPVRGELSIMASILTLGHNIAFGRRYFGLLFTKASEMRSTILMASVCSLLMMTIMIPLFIMSFKTVRRRMKAARWKKIQRLAYGFYGLMYLHVMLLNVPYAMEGKIKGIGNVICYTFIYSLYFAMRVLKARNPVRKNNHIPKSVVCFAATAWIMAWTVFGGACYFSEAKESTIEEYRDSINTVSSSYTDGVFSGSALGYNGKLKVKVTVEGGQITDVTLKSSVEDEPYLSKSLKRIVPEIIEKNGTPGIDSVSGATSTSAALLEAVEDALRDEK